MMKQYSTRIWLIIALFVVIGGLLACGEADTTSATTSDTPTDISIPTPTDTPQSVPTTQLVQNVSPDSKGIYYGDSSGSEETQTFYATDPWAILWKCADTTGSMTFTVDDDQGNVIEMYGPYTCTTDLQTFYIHHSGLLRIGAIPLDMDGAYYYGAAK